VVRVVTISDTHTYHESVILPHGDILVHAGDFTFRGKEEEVRAFGKWFAQQPHKYKCLIAGNHDLSLDGAKHQEALNWLYDDCIDARFNYLQDSSVTLEIDDRKIKVYGSPWQPWFHDWAFNVQRGPKLEAIWSQIPEDTDLLITHGPPQGILDLCDHGEQVGCDDLLRRVKQLKLKLHVFGHIHESYGFEEINGTIYANASSCNLRYNPVNPPLVFDI